MKKMIGLAVGAVAMVVLSGCQPSNGGSTVNKVDILDLTDGYVIEGTDQDNKDVELDFCGNRYVLYHDGADFSGTFSIGDSDYRINMFQKSPTTGSYRIDTDNGFLWKNSTYEIKYNGYDISIDTITKECIN